MKKGILTFALILLVFSLPKSVFAGSIMISPPKYEFFANPGQIITDKIKIKNGGNDSLTLIGDTKDFVARGESGQPGFVNADKNQPTISLGTWIKLPGKAITIPPRGEREIPFTISVPADAEPGGHYGTIFFGSPSPKTTDGQVGIRQQIGALVLVRVDGKIVESGRLDTFGIYDTKIPGEEIPNSLAGFFFTKPPVPFAIRFENEGNVHLKPEGKIKIFNTFGGQLDPAGVISILNDNGIEIEQKIVDYIPVNDARGNVLAHSFRTYRSKWQGEPFWYKNEDGTKEIRYKGYPIGLYTAKLTLNSSGSEEITATTRFLVFPWKEILGGSLGIIIVIFGTLKFLTWRRQKLEEEFKKKFGVKGESKEKK